MSRDAGKRPDKLRRARERLAADVIPGAEVLTAMHLASATAKFEPKLTVQRSESSENNLLCEGFLLFVLEAFGLEASFAVSPAAGIAQKSVDVTRYYNILCQPTFQHGQSTF